MDVQGVELNVIKSFGDNIKNLEFIQSEVNVEELYKLPLITREDGSANKLLVESSLKKNKINIDNLNFVLSLNSPQSIKSSVSFGQGYSFLPAISFKKPIAPFANAKDCSCNAALWSANA